MASYNKVILLGNLTRDPELRMTPAGTAVVKFSLAVNRTYLNQQQQKVEETTFIDVESWGKQAETIAKYFIKGKPIFVEGRLKLNSWEKDGKKQSKLSVVMEEFQFVDGGKREGGAAPEGEPAGAPPPRPPRQPGLPGAPTPPPDFADDDSVPF